MKSRITGVLILLVLISSSFSCIVTSHDVYVDISCDDFVENPKNMVNDFEIEIGDKLYVELCSNPTTGFEWSYEMSNDAAVVEEDHDYEEPQNESLGAAGKETWTFEGTKKGTAEIFMEYSQPWDGGTKQEWTYRITVTVQ